ncbi:uncharacterized protein N7515_001268 [Penicillium bovifimosum]|uniref:Uncharacterized protein n=1 Tax=Penicillium bovifimosum TaxID=126998 RepID=A0A9W9H9C7_9EURO|nr:uncharacterized protein N7515_001268 [Penicillium bovifimosum]KAJ5142481.1 hypothetical protein N7515_001268 [Penicillium bovifimosum]
MTMFHSSRIMNYEADNRRRWLKTLPEHPYPNDTFFNPLWLDFQTCSTIWVRISEFQQAHYVQRIDVQSRGAGSINTLRSLKVNPNSDLYNQANESIKSLTAMVDPKIPLEFSGNYPIGDSNSAAGSSGTGSGREGGTVSGSIYSDGSAGNFQTRRLSFKLN